MRKRIVFLTMLISGMTMLSTALAADYGREKMIFLHHSTGRCIYDANWYGDSTPNPGPNNVPDWIARYNASTGTQYSITDNINSYTGAGYSKPSVDRYYPNANYPRWDNYPFDYWDIWVNHSTADPYLGQWNIGHWTALYDVIIFKHCYPVSSIAADSGAADITSRDKEIQNYKLQYNVLKAKLHEFSDKKFILWNGAAMTKAALGEASARRARQFFDWVKNEWDESDDNIYLWNFFDIETGGEGPDNIYMKDEYANTLTDSHPNDTFSNNTAPLLARRIIDVLNSPAPGSGISFAEWNSTVPESAGSVNIPVKLFGVWDKTVSVKYSVTAGTATQGDDYVFNSGILEFEPGVTAKNISFTINNDDLTESGETIVLSLSEPAIAPIVWKNTHTLTITDKVNAVVKDGVIMGHGKYSESYMTDWSKLPTGKELIKDNLAKNIKTALGFGEGDIFDLKTGAGFQAVNGEQTRMVKVWKEGDDKELHLGNFAYKVNWDSAGSGDNILFYIEGYDRVVIENLAIIEADADYRLKNDIRIAGCKEVVIRNVYFAGTVSQAHISIYGCKYVLVENLEAAGIDYFGKGVYRNGGAIAVCNGEYVPVDSPKLLKWLTIQNCYIHDLDDGDHPQGDPEWRNQDGILLESPMDGILFNCYFENWKVKYGDGAIDAGHRGYRYPEGAAYSSDPDDPVSHYFRIERNIIDNCSHCKSPGIDSGNVLFWTNNLFINSNFTDYHYGFRDYFVHNTYIFDSTYEYNYFVSLESIAALTSDLAYFHNCLFYVVPLEKIRKINFPISQHWRDTRLDRWRHWHFDYNVYHIGALPDYWLVKQNSSGNNITLDEWKQQGNDANSLMEVWETLDGNLLANTASGNSGDFTDWINDNPGGWVVSVTGGETAVNQISQSAGGQCCLKSDGVYTSIYQAVLSPGKLYKYGISITDIVCGGVEILDDGPVYYYEGDYTGYFTAKTDRFIIKRVGKTEVIFDDVWVKEVTTVLPEENYFVNYNTGDFRLLNGSPAADAGSMDYLNPADYRMKVIQDFYGTSRQTNPSCGTFEDYSKGYLIGDINGDEQVNVLDVQLCVNVLLGFETDLDRISKAKAVAEPEDKCDILDVQAVVNTILRL